MSISRRHALGLAASSALASRAHAQAPPIKVIFPFGAGGPGDAITRLMADTLGKAFNRTSIVENRTGADGRIGIQAVKAAPPDGTTFLVTTGPTMALMPQVHKAPGYDPEVDFEPVAHVSAIEFCLVVATSTPAKTMAEFVAWAKANPDKATYAVPGLGTIPHFAGVALSKLIDVDMRRLPYRGGQPAMNDIVGGQVPSGFMTLGDALPSHEGGLTRIIATLGAKRSPFTPSVPTMLESGYPIEGEAWYGLWAPAKTSADVIAAANKAAVEAVKDAANIERFNKMGMRLTGTTAEDLRMIRRKLATDWAPTIKASGFTMEQ